MKEFKYWMPCFANLQPVGALKKDEAMIHYWLPDRCNEYWAIVPAERVFSNPGSETFGNQFNPSLKPALFLVERLEFPEKNYFQIFLDDLNQKWIKAHWQEDLVFVFTESEMKKKLANPEWVRDRFANFAGKMRLKIGWIKRFIGRPTLNLETGLLE